MDEKVFKPVSGWLLLLFAFGLILAIVFLEDPIYKIISGFVLALVLIQTIQKL